MPPGSPARFQTASSNYRISEFAAAVLRAQLARLPEHNKHRERRWKQLVELLAQVPGVTPQGRDPRCTLHPHCMALLALDPESRGGPPRSLVITALQAEGIPAYPMVPPIYRLPAFWDAPSSESVPAEEQLAAACTNSEHLGSRGLFLRHEALLGDEGDIQDIADAMEKVLSVLSS
jgi:3-amino-5-hydroxybenzoate synthase